MILYHLKQNKTLYLKLAPK